MPSMNQAPEQGYRLIAHGTGWAAIQ